MNNIIKKYIGKSSLMIAIALMATGTAMTSCSDDTLSNINTDKTKVSELDPNAQLTTALLQTYGDFSLINSSLKFEITAKRLCAASRRVL